MAPKTSKAKAKAKSSPSSATATMATPDQCTVDALNMEHYRELEDALQTIYGHPLFQNVQNEDPIGIKEGAQSHLAGHKAGVVLK